jgi:iron complex outermembrane receptor protein
VAGVNQHGGYNDFVMRGFRTGPGNFALNGQRLGATYYTPQVTYHLERIEILRGPASVLYGTANPGGVINMVTKTPQEQARYKVNLAYGSFNSLRAMGDATGKLTKDGKVLYRLIAGYENSGSLQQFLNTKHYFINPSVTFRPTQQTDITLTASYLHQNQEGGGWYNRGIMAPEGDFNALPVSWTHHEKEDQMHDYIANVQVQAAHRFSEKFSLHLLGRYAYYDFGQTYHHVRWNSYVPQTGLIRREYRDFSDYNRDNFINAYGIYRLSTGPVSHTLLAGIDYGLSNRYYDAKYARTGVPGLHIFNPQYGQCNVAAYIRDGFNGTYDQRLRLLGGYIQDQLEILPNLKAMVGLRYDTYLDRNGSVDRQASVTDPAKPYETSEDASEATALVPRAGIVYQPVAPVSLYASYSQSFEPQYSNLPESGGPFDPMRGKQWEAGVKGEMFGKSLVPAIAFYHIRQVNMLVADPVNPEALIPGNEATSRGAEFSLTGQVSGLNVIANYAYNETRITKSPDLTAENTNPWFVNAPNHQGNLWAVYSFASGAVKGLGIGAGLYATGRRYSNFPGFSVPGYRTFDALVRYQRQGFTVAANLYNLTDERYILATFNNRDSIFPGAPRNFRLSLAYTFQ